MLVLALIWVSREARFGAGCIDGFPAGGLGMLVGTSASGGRFGTGSFAFFDGVFFGLSGT